MSQAVIDFCEGLKATLLGLEDHLGKAKRSLDSGTTQLGSSRPPPPAGMESNRSNAAPTSRVSDLQPKSTPSAIGVRALGMITLQVMP